MRCQHCNEIIDLKEDKFIMGNKGTAFCSEECMEKSLLKTKFGTNDRIPKNYWGYEWVENYVYARDKYTCQICKNKFDNKYNSVADPEKNGLTMHHIIPLSKGGVTTPSNLITYCRDCHEQYEYRLQMIQNVPLEYLISLIM